MLTMFTTLMVSIVYCTSSVSSMILPPMSLHPPMLVPVDTTATAVSTPTLTYDDDDYDVDDDTIGDTPEQIARAKDTLVKAEEQEDDNNSANTATNVMRLMRGGRGRKSVHSQHNPKSELKHCYSSEPGGQRGSWNVIGSDVPTWTTNRRCTGLMAYDEHRVVQCMMSAGDGGMQDEPVWLVLAGDFNTLATYKCMTGTSAECVGIGAELRHMGYEHLNFGPTPARGNPNHGDSDTFFWPPIDHKLPPIRVSFRHVHHRRDGTLRDANNNVTRDWNEMHEADGTLRVPENWLLAHAVQTFGHIPDALLFSTGRSHVPRTDAKDCTYSRNAANFLRMTDRVTIKRQLWVSVGSIAPNTAAANNILTVAKGPTNQQCLWDAECSRMQCKLHRIPFVDLAARTSAAALPPYPNVFEKDGKHYGIALVRETVRNWLPFLCHELHDVSEK